MSQDVVRLVQLVEVIRKYNPNRASSIHSEQHWKCVAVLGHILSQEVPNCDLQVIILFSLFHDSMRITDGFDPLHGRRGGQFARLLHGQLFVASPQQMSLLQTACDAHTYGKVCEEPTIGVCWDADRLDLWRCGARPNSDLLSTSAARKASIVDRARNLHQTSLEWGYIASLYKLM